MRRIFLVRPLYIMLHNWESQDAFPYCYRRVLLSILGINITN